MQEVIGWASLSNGKFNCEHGKITNKLGHMFLKLVERYSHRANWRGYTYVDEMRGQALVQLSYIGLQFNEMKSDNPFAYFTQIVYYAFLRRIQKEKRQMDIRTKIIERSGFEEVMTADGNFNSSDYNTIKENIQTKQYS